MDLVTAQEDQLFLMGADLFYGLKGVTVANDGVPAQKVINGVYIAQYVVQGLVTDACLSLLLLIPVPVPCSDFFGYGVAQCITEANQVLESALIVGQFYASGFVPGINELSQSTIIFLWCFLILFSNALVTVLDTFQFCCCGMAITLTANPEINFPLVVCFLDSYRCSSSII